MMQASRGDGVVGVLGGRARGRRSRFSPSEPGRAGRASTRAARARGWRRPPAARRSVARSRSPASPGGECCDTDRVLGRAHCADARCDDVAAVGRDQFVQRPRPVDVVEGRAPHRRRGPSSRATRGRDRRCGTPRAAPRCHCSCRFLGSPCTRASVRETEAESDEVDAVDPWRPQCCGVVELPLCLEDLGGERDVDRICVREAQLVAHQSHTFCESGGLVQPSRRAARVRPSVVWCSTPSSAGRVARSAPPWSRPPRGTRRCRRRP